MSLRTRAARAWPMARAPARSAAGRRRLGAGGVGQPFQGLELVRREGAHLRLKSGVLDVGLLVYCDASLGQLSLEALEGAGGGVAAAAEVLDLVAEMVGDGGVGLQLPLTGLAAAEGLVGVSQVLEAACQVGGLRTGQKDVCAGDFALEFSETALEAIDLGCFVREGLAGLVQRLELLSSGP